MACTDLTDRPSGDQTFHFTKKINCQNEAVNFLFGLCVLTCMDPDHFSSCRQSLAWIHWFLLFLHLPLPFSYLLFPFLCCFATSSLLISSSLQNAFLTLKTKQHKKTSNIVQDWISNNGFQLIFLLHIVITFLLHHLCSFKSIEMCVSPLIFYWKDCLLKLLTIST